MGWLSNAKLKLAKMEKDKISKLHTDAIEARENIKRLEKQDKDTATIKKYKQLKHKHSIFGKIEAGIKTASKIHRNATQTKTNRKKPKTQSGLTWR